jgi:6-phosphofructokinase 1
MTLRAGDRLGLLTSGGDAPGMNAALRGAARVASALGLEVVGIEEGYAGLIEGRARDLSLPELDEASRRGGTLLGSSRSALFPSDDGQRRARESIVSLRLAALVVIGGNGSLTGAHTLAGAPTAGGDRLGVGGIPASIDNDLACTSMAIGVDTAMNTIVEAIDRICDTAASHHRTFLVEVMGRECGYLAITAAVAAAADAALVPEVGRSEDEIVDAVVATMHAAYRRDGGKRRAIVVKAEGVKIDIGQLKRRIDERMASETEGGDTRVTVLGHTVRGGPPTAFDRLLGARLGNACVRGLLEGQSDFMAGWIGPGVTRPACAYDPYIVLTPLDEVLRETARLMAGDSELAQWRRRAYREIEPVLAR